MLFINFTLKRFIKINKILTFENLKFQILYGFVINYMGALWYQWNLIFFSICYYLIPLCTKNNITFLILLINITVFILQYNGKNYDIFSKYHDGRYITFGRIVEMIPFSVIGFIIASQKIIIYLRKYKLKVFLFCIYSIFFLFKYKVFSSEIKGNGYHGMKIFLESILIFICFSMFPSEKIKNKKILQILKKITNYTAGIYYIHETLFRYCKIYFIIFKKYTFKGCIIIYLICYLICFSGSIVFGKTKLRNLFE